MPTTLVGPNGVEVKVSAEGELFTHARSQETMGFINQNEGHVWTMPFDALDPTSDNDVFGYIKNESEVVDLHVRHFDFSSTVAGILEIQRVTGIAVGGTPVVLVNENDNFPTRVPKGIFESGVDITALTDGGVHHFMTLVADVQKHLTVLHDIILGPGSAMALHWVPGTGILTGTIKFYAHSPLEV